MDEPAKVQPGRLTVTKDGETVVVDQANQQILVFDKDGKLKLKFGKLGDRPVSSELSRTLPSTSRVGSMWSTPPAFPFRCSTRPARISPGLVRAAMSMDWFSRSRLAVDRFDQLWVVDTAEHSIRIFDRAGFPLRTFGQYGMTERALFYPVDVDLDIWQDYVVEKGLADCRCLSSRIRTNQSPDHDDTCPPGSL